MKKILVTIFFLFLFINAGNAAPIVELAAPRSIKPDFLPDFGVNLDSEKPASKPNITKHKKATVKSHKKSVKPKKKIVFKPDYNKISKMIEYGYYDSADKFLKQALARNSKDLKAQSLLLISMAKQCELDPAQKNLDILLKKTPNNSDLHYAQGIVYYQRTTSSNMVYRNNTEKLLNDSLNEFKKAINLDKNNARAYNAAGVISIVKGDKSAAKKFFESAVNADKTYSMAIDNLGTIYFIDKKYSQAEKNFNEALKYNSQNSTAMYHLAQIMMQKKDYANAISYLNNALALNPSSPAILNLIGKAYAAQGNEAAAINAFRKSTSIKPEFALSYLNLAELYQKRGDGEFAIEQLKNALDVNPDYNDAKLKIADISFANGNYNQAIAFYAQLVGINGYNEDALKGIANSYYSQAQIFSGKGLLCSNSDLLKSLDSINKAIEANSEDLELHLAKLKLSKLTNQPEQTKVALNKIIKTQNQTLGGLVAKGEAYLALDDYKNAQIAFDSAATFSKSTEDDLYLAEIFMYQKQYDCALNVLKKVLKNEPKNQEALSDLDYIQKSKKYADNYYKSAQVFLKSGKNSLATEYLSRSISINPSNPEANLQLAKIYDKQKDVDEAIKNYKAYVGLAPKAPDAAKIQKRIKCLENKL